jgi:precorrin-3B C17-methyltransferase
MPAWRTIEATETLARATDLVGYGPYLDLVEPVDRPRVRHEFDNREEAQRARFALELAREGRDVAVVSSGDPGVFAMATAVIEEVEHAEGAYDGVDIAIVPGVTAASAAAARVGAPLGHDFCCVSLSDVLKPWPVVEQRLEAVGAADFVVALYNPISRHRPWQLGRAFEILRRHRSADVPVVFARAVTRADERIVVTTLGACDAEQADMSTVITVGSSTTRAFTDSAGRTWVYTPRRYPSVD